MTTNERILLADDEPDVLERLTRGITYFGKENGHLIVGQATSVKQVETLLKYGLRPTVAIVDHNFPTEGTGQEAAAVIRQISPETKIISLSTYAGLTWGDENLMKGSDLKDLVQVLTNLQH